MLFVKKIKQITQKILSPLFRTLAPISHKEYHELDYWKKKKKDEGKLKNSHYSYFYTTHFEFEPEYFEGLVILDIGCGPRGSLEWADMTKRRIGLDPLAKEYLELGAKEHKMEYIDSPSEHIPLPDQTCDAVFSFNSLDHVEDVEKTLAEIKRVTRIGGRFMLLVEVNHPPTECEPHNLSQPELIEKLAPEFSLEKGELYKVIPEKGIYESIKMDQKIQDPLATKEKGYFSAKFIRI